MISEKKPAVILLVSLLLVATQTPQLRAAATIVVGDGGSIMAAVASANSGDTIEIRSNRYFHETLTWQNKFLTVRAADGFTPHILGINDADGTTSGAGGSFVGLTIDYVSAGTTGRRFSNLIFRNNVFNGKVSLGATGNYSITAVFEHNHFDDGFFASDTGSATYNITMRHNTSRGDVNFVGNAGPHLILVEDNHLAGELTFATTLGDMIDATVRRNEIVGPVIFAVGSFSDSRLVAENNLIISPPGGTPESGIDVRSVIGHNSATTNFTSTNNTVVGFDRGLTLTDVQGGIFNAQIQNMLLYNTDDIVGFTVSQIGNSLISDGTFAGQNGNFDGTPLFAPGYQLLPISPGVDDGSDAAAIELMTDLRGNPRILDGDGDGIAHVDVGALESLIPEPHAITLIAIAAAIMLAPARLRELDRLASIQRVKRLYLSNAAATMISRSKIVSQDSVRRESFICMTHKQ